MGAARPRRKAAQKIRNYNESEPSEDVDIVSNKSNNDKTQLKAKDGVLSSSSSVSPTKTPRLGSSGNQGVSKNSKSNSSSQSNISNNNSGSNSSAPSKESTVFIRSEIPNNWQPPARKNDPKFPNLVDLSAAKFTNGTRTTIDIGNGVTLTRGDHIFMVSEPPSEPYYIGRIMGFYKKRNLKSNANMNAVDNYEVKMNWYYRPRDILRQSSDSRIVYATMHTDLCPISSFRGKITVKHRDEITDLVDYRCQPSHFWFEKLFDRYMIKFYDILPTHKLINLPENYQQALKKRFAYVFVEAGRGEDLLVTPKNCVKCNQWCSISDSVECAKCNDWYHMLCLSPPLLKKPSRGYSWSCAKCSKELDDEFRKAQKNNLRRQQNRDNGKIEELDQEKEKKEEKQDETSKADDALSAKSENGEDDEVDTPPHQVPLFEKMALEFLEKDSALTLEERRQKEEWPFRYLGMHARLEDALDLEDRPYPRASSRLGTKHQANIGDWFGHREVYYDPDTGRVGLGKKKHKRWWKKSKPADREKSSAGGNGNNNGSGGGTGSNTGNNSNNNNNSKSNGSPAEATVEPKTVIKRLELPEEYKDTPPKQLPPWLKPRPAGYIERGLDDGTSSTLMWKQPEGDGNLTNDIDFFVFKKCRPIAKELKIFHNTPNFLDAIFKTLLDTNFDFDKSFQIVKGFTRQSLKEPTFSDEEVKRFEEGVRMFGSELLPVHRHVGTQKFGMIVRFYYLWKKTPNGHLIWDNFEGRRNKKISNKKTKSSDYVDSVADADDDSSYDNESSAKQHRRYECKHCKTTQSKKWFRAAGHPVAPADPKETIVALCHRCAKLWRLYAVSWEDPLEVLKKINQRGGNSWKKKIEYELAEDALKILEEKEKAKVARSVAGGNKRKSASPSLDEQVVTKKPKGGKAAVATAATAGASADSTNEVSKPTATKATTSATSKQSKKAAAAAAAAAAAGTTTATTTTTPTAATAKESKIKKEEPAGGSATISDSKKKRDSVGKPVNGTTTGTAASSAVKKSSEEERGGSFVNIKPAGTPTRTTLSSLMNTADSKNPDKKGQNGSAKNVNDLAVSELASDTTGYHYAYNENYTYNFENYDSRTQEFDNSLPEPKDDFTIPLSPKTKSSNSKDSPGLKHIISSNGLFAPNKRPCCVCRSCDEGTLGEIIICSNCGLNVHASCYGVPVPSARESDASSSDSGPLKMYNKEWCCDSCSNDLHPICSTYYGCSLCYSKEIDHDSAIVGAATSFPDALKRCATSFKWAHVICCLFGPDIKFEDARSMQGVVNLPLSLVKNEFKQCGVCGIKSGLVVNCELCQSGVHVTCAQDTSGYFIGFKIMPELEFAGGAGGATAGGAAASGVKKEGGEDGGAGASGKSSNGNGNGNGNGAAGATGATASDSIFDFKAKKLVRVERSGIVGVPVPIIICANHGRSHAPPTAEQAEASKGGSEGHSPSAAARKVFELDKEPNIVPLRERAVLLDVDGDGDGAGDESKDSSAAKKSAPTSPAAAGGKPSAPLLQLYVEAYKQYADGITGPALRHREMQLVKEELRRNRNRGRASLDAAAAAGSGSGSSGSGDASDAQNDSGSGKGRQAKDGRPKRGQDGSNDDESSGFVNLSAAAAAAAASSGHGAMGGADAAGGYIFDDELMDIDSPVGQAGGGAVSSASSGESSGGGGGKGGPLCHKPENCGTCGIIRTANWWSAGRGSASGASGANGASSACAFCAGEGAAAGRQDEEKKQEQRHYRDLDDISISEDLYGIKQLENSLYFVV